MGTTQKKANPSKGFQGVRDAIWVIVICFLIAYCIFEFVFGSPDNFVNGDTEGAVLNGNLLGTIYKGGFIVPIIWTLLFTVISLSIERYFALKVAFGKGSLRKFVIGVKQALGEQDFAKAQSLCDKQQGSVANVVSASLRKYKEMEETEGIEKEQKVAQIQQAHEEATQLEMPTLQMNLPIIGTIVTLGTLTGLLGTVVGMIKAFAALASGGGGDSLALSTGISEALVNTASGILTGALAVISYNYYTNKIDKLTYALDEVGYTIAQTYTANHKA